MLVLGEDGHTRVREDPIPRGLGPRPTAREGDRARARPAARASARRRTIRAELARMLEAGAIDKTEHDERRGQIRRAEDLVDKLSGARRAQLAGALKSIEDIAARGSLTVGRLEPLWKILDVNIRWANEGPLLSPGARVSVEGSELVFQYVAGSGLQLHPLANAGKLNDLWRKRNGNARVERLLYELLPLAAERSGGAAWEYYFPYAGSAPWVSGMAQATMLQATARASIRLGIREETWPLLKSGLTMFATAPPAGVRVPSGDGAHYVLYSQRPGLKVLNGFAQALVGLYDFGAYANDDIARTLYADGDRALRAELPAYDTGAWSLYSREEVVREADLGYHRIATGFVGGLCERTLDPTYCDYESRFTSYLTEPPRLEVLTRRIRGGTTGQVKFGLSKVSQVSLRITRGDKLVHAGSAQVPYGRRSFTWSAPRRRGLYGVQLTATDLAGNTASATGEVEVLKARKTRKRRR